MAVRGRNEFKLDRLGGWNGEDSSRSIIESGDCENVVGETTGFSVWKGRQGIGAH